MLLSVRRELAAARRFFTPGAARGHGASATFCMLTATTSGRDLKEITLSSHIRLGADGNAGLVVDTAAALGELDLDLAIGILPPPHDPAVLTPLADALTQLR